MAKSARKGSRYIFTGDVPWRDVGIVPGSIVQVVNLPGGSRGGIFRNVIDQYGNIDFVHIRSLTPIDKRDLA